jgi:prolyl 4-hydroxylase
MILGVPIQNFETFQLVRYKPGQRYSPHHDFLDEGKSDNNRVWTGLVYLTDSPPGETGGGTRFPQLGLTVQPREGTIVIWTNCTQQGCDSRTLHGGDPPLEYVKYAMNIWSRGAKTR